MICFTHTFSLFYDIFCDRIKKYHGNKVVRMWKILQPQTLTLYIRDGKKRDCFIFTAVSKKGLEFYVLWCYMIITISTVFLFD